jgi:hypothetical protein
LFESGQCAVALRIRGELRGRSSALIAHFYYDSYAKRVRRLSRDVKCKAQGQSTRLKRLLEEHCVLETIKHQLRAAAFVSCVAMETRVGECAS